MKFSIKDFFRKLRIWSYLLKKSLIENFIFGAVDLAIRIDPPTPAPTHPHTHTHTHTHTSLFKENKKTHAPDAPNKTHSLNSNIFKIIDT